MSVSNLKHITTKYVKSLLALAEEEKDSISAYNYALKAKSISKINAAPELEAASRTLLAQILIENNAFDQALNQVRKAIKFYGHGKSPSQEVKCWRLAAIIYRFLGDHKNQLKYNQHCLTILSSINKPLETIKIKNNIGDTLLYLKNYKEAKKIFLENYKDENTNSKLKCVSLKNIAKTLFMENNYEMAKLFLWRTLKLSTEQGLFTFQSASNYYLGKIFYHEKRYEEAIKHLLDAESRYVELGKVGEERAKILDGLVQTQLVMGLSKEAAETFDKYKLVVNNINQQFLNNSIKYSKFKFEINEIDKERKLLAKQNLLLKKANTKIEKQKIELENKSELLSIVNNDLRDFAHIVAHDLKQPVRNIYSFVQLLEEEVKGNLNKIAEEYLTFIKNGSKNITTLISDILNYSKADDIQKKIALVDCNKVLEKVMQNLYSQIKNSKGIIKVDKLPSVKGHSTPLVQIFQNIISNSIKFHKPGEVPEVNVSGWIENNRALFKIKDNGIGINEKNKREIFQMFTRLNTKEEYEGTGIGLSTVLRLVNLYKGTINVESEKGKGTTFVISFPSAGINYSQA